MDDPMTGAGARVRLLRACERNRLDKEFLSHAYECLVAVVTVGDCPRRHNERFGARDYQAQNSAHPSIVLGGPR
jgi:hypothetical protein